MYVSRHFRQKLKLQMNRLYGRQLKIWPLHFLLCIFGLLILILYSFIFIQRIPAMITKKDLDLYLGIFIVLHISVVMWKHKIYITSDTHTHTHTHTHACNETHNDAICYYWNKVISTYHWLFAQYCNDKCKLTGKFFKVSLGDFCCKSPYCTGFYAGHLWKQLLFVACQESVKAYHDHQRSYVDRHIAIFDINRCSIFIPYRK